MKRMMRFWLIGAVFSGLIGIAASAAAAPSLWEQPAANLAEEIAGILGPGQARLTIRNLSSVPADEIPAIRRLLEQNLKTHGVLASGTESANTIRVTLSENARERLWVAEVIQGNETRVAMVHVAPGVAPQMTTGGGLTLRKQLVLTTGSYMLAAVETPSGLVVIEPEQIVVYGHAAGGWQTQKKITIGQIRPLARDPRALILPSTDGSSFEAFAVGSRCSGVLQPATGWTTHCHESDDPWPIPTEAVPQTSSASSPSSLKAFYNSARNYFTGVVTPVLGVDIPPFYSAALIPHSDGVALLINGIDGKVQIVTNGALKSVAGTRDWGSDVAALNTGCGAGTQIIASGSGEAATDSLRAYDLPGLEAIPASAPLTMDGTVTALWTAPDGKNLFAVVRNAANQYEEYRVTASCN
jgi:hypothetical protein